MQQTDGSASVPRGELAVVVLDFDGTLTDADAHADAFHEASRDELARLAGWSEGACERHWQRAREVILGLPAEAAWEVDGLGVCPAAADPYLIANSITRMLLLEERGAVPELAELVFGVHRVAYQRVKPPFRPEAREVLQWLLERYAVWVVTNSHTATVEQLLDGLAFRGRERLRVRGGASKFTVCDCMGRDPRFEALPAAARWQPLGRPVHLRRGRYFDVLRSVWLESAAEPRTTLVAGDIFELDLAMPHALGAHVHLVLRRGTLPHERALAESAERGGCSLHLTALFERLQAT